MSDTNNRLIHEFLGKGCRHGRTNSVIQPCPHCGEVYASNPDYENSLDAVHEAELKAVEVFGIENVNNKLDGVLFEALVESGEYPMPLRSIEIASLMDQASECRAFANAKYRAAAIVRLIEENK